MSPKRNVTKWLIPGTKRNPFTLEWPKPASGAYPTLYFGGPIGKPRSQATLKRMLGRKDATGTAVRAYTPHRGGTLPGGSRIGIAGSNRISVGKIVGPLSNATTPGGGKI